MICQCNQEARIINQNDHFGKKNSFFYLLWYLQHLRSPKYQLFYLLGEIIILHFKIISLFFQKLKRILILKIQCASQNSKIISSTYRLLILFHSYMSQLRGTVKCWQNNLLLFSVHDFSVWAAWPGQAANGLPKQL